MKNMSNKFYSALIYLLLFLAAENAAGSFNEPWSVKQSTQTTIRQNKTIKKMKTALGSPPGVMMMTILGFYQKNLSPIRVHHCPCYPSCSAYFKQAVKDYGTLVGLLMITDRMFYRENSSMHFYYPTVNKSGQSRFLDLPEADYIFHRKKILPDGGIVKYEKN